MKKKGFTLIELIVVIASIGVLAAILVPAMMGYVKKSKITSANSAAKSIYTGAQSAITDMNSEDAPMAALSIFQASNGDTVGGKSGTSVTTAPANSTSTATADVLAKFRYRIYVYFSDINKLNNAWVKLSANYDVLGVGVIDSNNYVGTHPKQMTVDKYDKDFKTTQAQAGIMAYACA